LASQKHGDWVRLMMEKERLEWVMSGLSYYHLTAREDQFVKSVKQDFNQKICSQKSRKKN
jgi:hypothetical protein